MKGLLEPPVKTTFVNQVLFFPPFPKELVTSPTRIDTSIHPCWKSHPSSCSLKEKASQECPEAIPRLPQIHLDQGEGGKGNRKSREDGLMNPPCNSSGLVLSLREGEEWRALTCWVAATGAHWTEGLWDTPESNPGQSSSIVPAATHLLAEGLRRKKRENPRGSLRGSSEYQRSVRYQSKQNEPKPSQPESYSNMISQSHKPVTFPQSAL